MWENGKCETAAQWTARGTSALIKEGKVGGVTPRKGAYLFILPRVLAADALNLSGRISIPTASWPNRRCCPAHPPVLAESALSGSLPLSSVPTHSSLHLTVMGRRVERCTEEAFCLTGKPKRGEITQPAWNLCPGLAAMRMQCCSTCIYYLGVLFIHNNSLVKRMSKTLLIAPL